MTQSYVKEKICRCREIFHMCVHTGHRCSSSSSGNQKEPPAWEMPTLSHKPSRDLGDKLVARKGKPLRRLLENFTLARNCAVRVQQQVFGFPAAEETRRLSQQLNRFVFLPSGKRTPLFQISTWSQFFSVYSCVTVKRRVSRLNQPQLDFSDSILIVILTQRYQIYSFI